MNARSGLALSLLLNIALLAVAAYLFQGRSGGSATPVVLLTREDSAGSSLRTSPAESGAEVVAPEPGTTFDWESVESPDYRQYIANLRTIGCPEETIRDIIIADVEKLYATRVAELRPSRQQYRFWETGLPLAKRLPDEETLGKQLDLAAEKRTVLKELLGIEITEEPGTVFQELNPLGDMLDFLPGEKRNQMLEIEQKYSARMLRKMDGPLDRAEIGRVQRAKEAEIQGLLTPEEFEDYELRMSQTATLMRYQLDGFEPTEEEFRKIFRARKEFEEAFGPFNFNPAEEGAAERRLVAEREMRNAIREALGSERFLEYERIQDWAYKGALRITKQEGLPRESAVRVWEMKSTAADQAHQIRTDARLDNEQRQIALSALREDTELNLISTLGKKGYEAYAGQSGGSWVNRLGKLEPPPVVEMTDAVMISVGEAP